MARKRQFPPSVDPGLPREPVCPAGWERSTFGDLLTVVERPVELDDEIEYQLVNAQRSRGGIVYRDRLKGKEIKVKTQFEIRAGDFLISRRQIIHGACGVVPPSLDGAIVSNEYATLRPRDGLLLDYLKYLSHTPHFQRTCFHSSVGVDVEKMIFRLEQWFRFSLPIPTRSEQLKIATILSSVDETIEKTEAAIEQLRLVQQAIMQTLLRRGLPGHHSKYLPLTKEWRLGRLEGVTDVPESWRLVRLASVAGLESGHTPSKRNPDYWDGDIPWVSLHDSKHLDVHEIFETAQRVSGLGIDNSSARLLPRGTVVFSRTATVGKCTILGRDMATSQDFANYICGEELFNRYLMHLFRNMGREWVRLMAGSTHKTIYMPVFRELQILLPPKEEQETIAKVGDLLESRLAAERNVLDGLRLIKNSLLVALLSGEIRVPLTEPAA